MFTSTKKFDFSHFSAKKRRSGSVIVLVALSMTMLLGFCAIAVDYGRMVATRNQLQRTCDAAALAGAAELPLNTAYATYYAQLAATHNGVAVAETAVAFPASNQIRVTATRQVRFLFAPILGITSGTVNATALAGRTNPAGAAVVPLAITVDDYMAYGQGTTTFGTGDSFSLNTPFTGPNFGESLTVNLIRNTKEDFTAGTVTALDLRPDNSGASPAQFQQDIEEGYNGAPVSLNSDADSLRASETAQGDKLVNGIGTRITRAAASPWNVPASSTSLPYTFPDYGGREDNPRIMLILVGNPNAASNNQPQVHARALVPVWVESATYDATNGASIKMRILPHYTLRSEDPNLIIGDDSTPSTGVSVIRLLS